MMIRHLMGVVVCVFIATASFSQICTDPLTVTIEGSSTGDNLNVTCMGTNPQCNVLSGDLNGMVDVTVTGGTTPYTYAWTGPGVVAGLPGQQDLGAGTYSVTVTDDNNCTFECEATLVEPPVVTLSLDPTNLTCAAGTGDPSGGITANPGGGTAAAGTYTYAWDGPAGANITPGAMTQSDLIAGTYSVTVTDDNGCTADASTTLDQPEPITIALDPTDPICHSNNTTQVNGMIDLAITDGVSPFTFAWTGPDVVADAQNQTNLDGGSYSVIVTDANGCTAEANVDLNEATEITLAATPVDPDCNVANMAGDGTITIDDVPNAVAPLTYAWTGPDTDNAAGANQSGLGAGNYSVIITDANGCTVEGDWVLSEPEAMELTFDPVDPTCNAANTDQVNGTIGLTVTNGDAPYTYNWSGPDVVASSQNQSNVGEGTYMVTVTDANGCEVSGQVSLGQPAEITFTGTPNNPACFNGNGAPDGTITITGITGGAGGYTFAWTGTGVAPTAQDQSDLGEGTYTVVVSDALGCSAEQTFNLTEPEPMTIALDPTDPICHSNNTTQVNGMIDLAITEGVAPFTFAWTGNGVAATSQNQTNLDGGAYSVIVTDATGCTAEANVNLTEATEITIAATPVDPDCNVANMAGDGTITIDDVPNATAPLTYAWTGPDTDDAAGANQSGLGAGNYSVVITDANGCTVEGDWVLSEPEAMELTFDPIDPTCNAANTDQVNGTIGLTVTNGDTPYTFNWSGPDVVASSQNQSNVGEGIYMVTVTDANGCEVSGQVPLGQPAEITFTGNPSNPACFSGNGAPDGTITLTGITGGAGGYTFDWSGPGVVQTAQDQSDLGEGTYTVIVSDALGCSAEQTFDLSEPDPLTIALEPVDPTCNVDNTAQVDGTINVAITNGISPFTYAWTGTDVNATADSQTNLGGGLYSVTVTDASGCSAEATVELEEPPAIAVIAFAENLTCHTDSYAPGESGDGSILLDQVVGGTPPYTFNWTGNGVVQTAQSQENLEAGQYFLTITDSRGCTLEADYELTQPDPVTVDGDVEPLLCNASSGSPSGSITITPGGGVGSGPATYTYNWAASAGGSLGDPASSQNQTGLSAGTYSVTVTDNSGCIATETWTLGEPEAVSCSLDATDINCNGDLSTITVTPGGGSGPYSYVLTGTTAGTTIDGSGNPIPPAAVGPTASQADPNNTFMVEAGTYTVEVTDANGCVSTCDITIDQPTQLVAGTCVTQDECQLNQGEIQVCAAEGVGPYTITWDSPVTGGTLTPPGGSPAVSGQVTGVVDCVLFTGAQGGETYVFTVIDANGCIVP